MNVDPQLYDKVATLATMKMFGQLVPDIETSRILSSFRVERVRHASDGPNDEGKRTGPSSEVSVDSTTVPTLQAPPRGSTCARTNCLDTAPLLLDWRRYGSGPFAHRADGKGDFELPGSVSRHYRPLRPGRSPGHGVAREAAGRTGQGRGGVTAFHDFQFTDRLAESGITFKHRIVDDAGKTYKAAHYDHGNGIAIADVDGDGLARHLLRQPGRRQPALEESRRRQIRGHHGGGRSRRSPGKVGVSASFADIDNDGDADLYVTTVRGGNMLFENDGHGRFRDISAASGLDYVGHSSARRVLRLRPRRPARPVPRQRRAIHDRTRSAGDGYKYYVAFEDAFSGHLKPERAERSILYHNEGGNRFVDVSQQTGAAWTSPGPATRASSTSTTTAGRTSTC